MTEVYALAEKIYNDAIFLKGQKSTSLIWRRNREKWLCALDEMIRDIDALNEILDYSYSEEYWVLLSEMKALAETCKNCLLERADRYMARCVNYMQAFHNLPRAFFAPENLMRISIEEAREYAEFWLRHLAR